MKKETKKVMPKPELKKIVPSIKSIPTTSLQWNRTSPL